MTTAEQERTMTDQALDPASRVYRLRELFWRKTHEQALVHKHLVGCGDPSLIGHAHDFATLLEASDPFIQPEELIVGCCLTYPDDRKLLDLGYYNRHYPPGHVTLLRLGLRGMHDEALERLEGETDPAKREFLQAVVLSYEAACRYVERYAVAARALAAAEANPTRRAELESIAAVCHALTIAPPDSFHAALQLVQFTRVLGGHGTMGRFDQWMAPFLQRDLATGRLTPEQAQELLECFFVKMNFYADLNDNATPAAVTNDNLRNICLAGQTPEGDDACNALTFMCLRASARLMLPEPKLNVRFFVGTPPALLRACAEVLAKGANILAVFNDEVAVPSLVRVGIPIEDARDYCNDGCAELIIGGKSTIRFQVFDALPMLTELVTQSGDHHYATFDEVLGEVKARLTRFMPTDRGEKEAITFPFFAASIADCLPEASPWGARYGIRGAILAQVGNAADGLAAIKRFIYEEHSVTWEQLTAALQADYEGHEPLRQMIRHRAPKYGNDNDHADALAREMAEFYCEGVHARAGNTPGRGIKWAPGFHSFGIHNKSSCPASPDGRKQGEPTANSFSPAVGMDRHSPTAVLKSAAKVDLSKASHGSVLDIALHSSVVRGEEGMGKFVMFLETFLKLRSTTSLQMNIIDREQLLRARADPTAPQYRTLIVRVWGFSAVFVELPTALQDHVLARTEHGLA
jgi:formate C-acetyltransferase